MPLRKKGNLYFGEYSDLGKAIGRSGDEEVHYCPYCLELRGKPDKKGKMYYNVLKQVAHCFSCEAIIISDALRTADQIRQQLDTPSDEERYNFQKLSLDTWASPVNENQKCLDYMVKERNIFPEVLGRFNILSTRSPRDGVVFVNKTWKEGDKGTLTDFLIIRNMGLGSYLRYTVIKDQVKPLMWCDQVNTDLVILVEGTISGLSAYQHLDGVVSPLILLGKSISDFQVRQLKMVCYSKRISSVYVALDGGYAESGLKIARIIDKVLANQEVFVCKLPWKSDPNSLSKREFKNVFYSNSYLFNPLSVNIIRDKMYGGR